MIAFIVVDALSPANNCGARLLLSPLTTDATIKRIPTPPIITVKTVCKVAAVFAPLILINVIKKEILYLMTNVYPNSVVFFAQQAWMSYLRFSIY